MTDEKRLGLPEEPPRELYSNLMLLSDHHATWGSAWREWGLAREKERDELLQKLRGLEVDHDLQRIRADRMESLLHSVEKERDELRAQLKLAVDAVNRFITAKIDKGEMK
jgi:hypothetical protein